MFWCINQNGDAILKVVRTVESFELQCTMDGGDIITSYDNGSQ